MRRRTGPDIWVTLLPVLSASGWVMLLVFQVLVWLAKPEMDTGLIRYLGLERRSAWLSGFIPWLPIPLAACLLLTGTALWVGRFRSRRRLDSPGWNRWFLLALAVGSLGFYGFMILPNTTA